MYSSGTFKSTIINSSGKYRFVFLGLEKDTGNLFLPIKIIISVSTNRRGEEKKGNNVTIVIFLLCHKTSMLIVKYNHQTVELLWHLDYIRGTREWAHERCAAAAAPRSHSRWMHSAVQTFNPLPTQQSWSWCLLQLGMLLNQPLARRVTNIDNLWSRTGFPGEVLSLQVEEGMGSRCLRTFTALLNCRLDLIVDAIKHFLCSWWFFFASFSARKGEKGQQMWT